MSLFSKNTCPRCGAEYSAFSQACPKCGAKKVSTSYRANPQSDTVRRGSPAQARYEADSRWQTIFGLCLVAAVVIAVIVLIMTTLKGGYEIYPQDLPPTEIETSPTPTPTQTPTPVPTPHIESVTITFLGVRSEQFAMSIGDTLQFRASIYPVEYAEEPVTWSTSDPDIARVDADGVVTGISAGATELVLRCHDAAVKIPFWVT